MMKRSYRMLAILTFSRPLTLRNISKHIQIECNFSNFLIETTAEAITDVVK